MAEKKGTLVRGLTIVTVFTLITGAMVGMAWATLTNTLFAYAGPAVAADARSSRPSSASSSGSVTRSSARPCRLPAASITTPSAPWEISPAS